MIATLVAALPASASFAGRNGVILLLVDAPPGATGYPDGPEQFWTVAAHDGAVAHEVGVASARYDQHVAAQFTPDGRHIVYLHSVGSRLSSLDMMDAGGGHRQVLVQRVGISTFAVSPDGEQVAFTLAGDSQTPFALYVRSLRTGHVRGVARRFDPALLAWGVDGRLYSLCSARRICTFDPTTGDLVDLPLPQGVVAEDGWPSVSPDLKRVALYRSLGPAGVRIYTTAGAFQRNLAGPYCAGPFSPDSTKLLTEDYCGGTNVKLSVFDFRTHRQAALSVDVPLPPGATDRVLDWQPLPR